MRPFTFLPPFCMCRGALQPRRNACVVRLGDAVRCCCCCYGLPLSSMMLGSVGSPSASCVGKGCPCVAFTARPPARPPAPRDAKSRKKRGASCSCCAAWPLGARLRVAVLGSNVNASATYDSLLVLHSFSSLFSESELEPFAQGMERSPAVSRRRIAPRTHGICPPQEGRRRLGCRLLSAVGSPNQVERYNYRAFSFSASVEWLEIFRRGHLEPLSAEYASTCMSCSFGATDCRTINLAHRPCCCCGRCCCSDQSCCRTTRDYKPQEFPLPRSLGRDGLRTRKALGWL